MGKWKNRAEVLADVVYFNYFSEKEQLTYEEVFVWDLDRTYLDTHWGSLRELFKTAFEKAFQKRNVPGTRSLVQALMSSRQAEKPFPIYFITASPPLLESRILEKLELDGLFPFGMFFKDNLKNLHPKRLRRLTQQVGYKIQSLLQLRLRLSKDLRQILWGDDSEADAIIYSLYSDICQRRLSPSELRNILSGLYVTGKQLDVILRLQSQVPIGDPVEKIYINLAVDTDPEYYLKFGRRVVPTNSTFQASVDLFQDGRLPVDQVVRVAQDLIMNYGFSKDEIESELDDLIRRQILGKECMARIVPVLQAADLISLDFVPTVKPGKVDLQSGERVFRLEGVTEPWVPEHIDYLHDYR
ncbi:hypothetical protein COB52_04825 [Candidatus Kaiserbacteria bacterium]|nr:MAG: hypothetical protein COB52_04825 [Candidatus Kaiserbacteria bacterium]